MLTYNNIHMHCVKDYAGTRNATVSKKRHKQFSLRVTFYIKI